MTKILHEILDINDDGEHVEKVVEATNQLTVQEASLGGAVVPIDDGDEQKIRDDFVDASNNIKDALEWAKEAAEKVLAIATDSEADKDFNALNGLLKTIIDGSEKSVSLYTRKMEYFEKKRKVYAPSDEQKNVFNIDKAVFSGTLDQMISAVEESDIKKEEDN